MTEPCQKTRNQIYHNFGDHAQFSRNCGNEFYIGTKIHRKNLTKSTSRRHAQSQIHNFIYCTEFARNCGNEFCFGGLFRKLHRLVQSDDIQIEEIEVMICWCCIFSINYDSTLKCACMAVNSYIGLGQN